MKTKYSSASLLALLLCCTAWQEPLRAQSTKPVPAPRPPGQNPNGMHIYLWAGLKTHQPGQHDYPQFLADWSKLLTEHGAIVDGALHPPTADDLAHTDVVVIYKGDAGYPIASQQEVFDRYIGRGGGLVNIHDALCGPDPASLAVLLGGAKKHGEVNYTLGAPVHYQVADAANPIMKDFSDITIFDEAFFNMTWAKDPAVHVLASAKIADTPSAAGHVGEVVPQIWTYEHSGGSGGSPARAFVWMQGHLYANLSNYQIQRTLLRGIAWAAKRPVDELVDYKPVAIPAHGVTPAAQPGH